jgi:hypothetical protein
MRSIDYIADRSIPVDWTSIGISVGAGSNPNLKASAVNAEISGVIYAKN